MIYDIEETTEFQQLNDIDELSELSEKEITLEKILSMPSESLIDKILEFCEEYYLDVSEVLHVFEIKENKEFLYTNCVEHNIIKDPELKKLLDQRMGSWED